MGVFNEVRGMIGRDFSRFDAMVFRRCSAVHTFFMSMELDIVFAGCNNTVLKTVERVRPWRFCVRCPEAYFTIELPAGAIERSLTQVGDTLDLYAGLTDDTAARIGKFLFENKTGKLGTGPVNASEMK